MFCGRVSVLARETSREAMVSVTEENDQDGDTDNKCCAPDPRAVALTDFAVGQTRNTGGRHGIVIGRLAKGIGFFLDLLHRVDLFAAKSLGKITEKFVSEL